MNAWPHRVGILGAGALGTFLAHQVTSHTSSEVWLAARTDHAGWVQVEGGKPRRVRVVRPGESGPALDLLVVTVKAYDTGTAIDSALSSGLIGASTLLLTLQNGLGNAQVIADRVGGERTFCGVTGQGATLLAPGLVRHGGSGPTELGALRGESGGAAAARIAAWLTAAGLSAEAVPDYRVPLWRKLGVNCAINPLTALLRVPNGELLRRPEATALMDGAAREAEMIAMAEGIRFEQGDLAARARAVALATAHNRSSMLQDVERGRRTEVEAISGAVAALGRRHGLPTPVNATLAALVRSLQP